MRFPNWGDAIDLVDVMDVQPDGDLVASFTVEAMVRAFADPTRDVDHRTAL